MSKSGSLEKQLVYEDGVYNERTLLAETTDYLAKEYSLPRQMIKEFLALYQNPIAGATSFEMAYAVSGGVSKKEILRQLLIEAEIEFLKTGEQFRKPITLDTNLDYQVAGTALTRKLKDVETDFPTDTAGTQVYLGDFLIPKHQWDEISTAYIMGADYRKEPQTSTRDSQKKRPRKILPQRSFSEVRI